MFVVNKCKSFFFFFSKNNRIALSCLFGIVFGLNNIIWAVNWHKLPIKTIVKYGGGTNKRWMVPVKSIMLSESSIGSVLFQIVFCPLAIGRGSPGWTGKAGPPGRVNITTASCHLKIQIDISSPSMVIAKVLNSYWQTRAKSGAALQAPLLPLTDSITDWVIL